MVDLGPLWILLSALIAFPAAALCLHNRNLRIAAPIVFGSVLMEIAVITPFYRELGWWGSYPVLFGALIFCKVSKSKGLRQISMT